MLWLSRPQTHAKESRGWRGNGCWSRASSRSPPGRDARRSPAGAVRRTLHRAALCPRPPHRSQIWLRLWPGRDYKRHYYLLGSVGRKALAIAGVLLRIPLKRLPGDGPGTPLVFAIDDSPTKRYGPHVRGRWQASQPHSGTAWVLVLLRTMSGSVWPAWSDTRSGERSGCRSFRICTFELKMSPGWWPTRAGSSTPSWIWPPRRLSGWSSIGPDHPPIWVLSDGAYVKRPLLKRVLAAGVT